MIQQDLAGSLLVVKRQHASRLILTLLYLLCAFIFLNWFYSGNPLSGEGNRPRLFRSVLRLTLFISLLDFLASYPASLIESCIKTSLNPYWVRAIVAGMFVGAVLVSLPGWIFKGYGAYRFQGTAADVCCLFEEGYGMVFPFTVAPMFALLTFARELLLGRLIKKQLGGDFSDLVC